jgi:sporulation protein YlmC with PRC-barrel domain
MHIVLATNVPVIRRELAMNNASLLIGKTINALDGEIGSVHDWHFDDQTWSIRYLVVDTGKWLPGRKVLVAPEAIVKPWHHQPAIGVKLTREQIRSSPDIDTAMPVSRVAEELLHRHYQWTPYWDSTIVPIPPMPPPAPALTVEEDRQEAGKMADVRLRSANELGGYHVKAGDGEVGHVEDLLLDDDLSRILFLVVEVKGWLFGKKVLAGPSLISRVDWATSTVHVDANCQALKSAQEYNPAA